MKLTIEETQYLPIAAAAQELSTTETRILMLLKRKALSGEQIEGTWYVTAASLACVDIHAQSAEQQPSCRSNCSSSTCGCR